MPSRTSGSAAIPTPYSSEEAAPLLLWGVIGYRAHRMTGDAKKIGSGIRVVRAHPRADREGRRPEVYAITTQPEFALRTERCGGRVPPEPLDAAIVLRPWVKWSLMH
jgi:propanol-preferring alcohol dehydrogenase